MTLFAFYSVDICTDDIRAIVDKNNYCVINNPINTMHSLLKILVLGCLGCFSKVRIKLTMRDIIMKFHGTIQQSQRHCLRRDSLIYNL